MFEALNVSLLASDTISESLRGIGMAADSAGDAAAESGVEFGAFGEALDSVDDDALAMAVGANTAKGAVDELGDEALQSSVELQALDSQMDDVARSSVGLAGSLGPLRGGLSTIGPLAAGIVPPLISLSGALGGVAAAGGGAAAGIAAIAGAGLQRQAENMAAASSQFEDSGEAMESIMSDFKGAISEAFEPLKTAANTEFAMSGLEGAVELAHAAAEGFAQMQDTLRPLASTFGAAVLESAPAVFDELDTTIQELTPTLEGFANAIRDIPAAIAWFREQAVALQPELGSTTTSALGAAAAVGSFGTTILELVLPPLSVALDILAWTANLLAGIPKPVLAAAAAFGIYAAVVATYGGVSAAASAATWSLVGAIATLTAPISGTALAIAAVVGAIAGVITYFGWWDDILGALTTVWNALISYIEFSLRIWYTVKKVISQLIGTFVDLVLTVTGLGAVLDWLGDMWNWIVGVVYDSIDAILGWIDSAVSALQDLMNWAMSVVNAIPGVNIDFGNIQKTINLDGLKADDGDDDGDDGDDRSPEQTTGEGAQKKTEQHYDFSGADFGGASQSQVERTVEEAVRKANRESRAREDAQQF